MTGLSDQQIENILVHELAHLKRNDYLLNIFQTFVEILFFYHPGIWWMSDIIRNERENCCDDWVLNRSGETLDYAKTLILLKEQDYLGSKPAMSLMGLKNSFSHRIKRLFNRPTSFADFKEGFVTAMFIVLGIVILSFVTSYSVIEKFAERWKTSEDQIYFMPLAAGISEDFREEIQLIQDYNTRSLFQTIEKGDEEVIYYLLKNGVDINSATSSGWTPLHHAINLANIDAALVLLQEGADITVATNQGRTPLMEAAEIGNHILIDVLLKRGVDVHARSEDGNSALFEAIDAGHAHIVNKLLEDGAGLNHLFGEKTPLMFAISKGQREIVERLTLANHDINQPNKNGWTPLMEAVDKNDLTMVRYLFDPENQIQ